MRARLVVRVALALRQPLFSSSSRYSQYAATRTREKLHNPLHDLERVMVAPLLGNDEVFTASEEMARAANRLFRPPPGGSIEHVKGVVKYANLPELPFPEVSFIGASNVGKSSLIKALLFSPSDREVKISISKKPGHTKVVKIYILRDRFSLVDMPGYGANMPVYFVESVEDYLLQRPNLVRTFLLVDSCLGLTQEDCIGIEMMEEFGKPYTLVLTKIDRLTKHELIRCVMALQKERDSTMPAAFPQPFLISSKTSDGVAYLRAFIANITGNLEPT